MGIWLIHQTYVQCIMINAEDQCSVWVFSMILRLVMIVILMSLSLIQAEENHTVIITNYAVHVMKMEMESWSSKLKNMKSSNICDRSLNQNIITPNSLNCQS